MAHPYIKKVDIFIEEYCRALEEYLKSSFEEEGHEEDLACTAMSFAEAHWAISKNKNYSVK